MKLPDRLTAGQIHNLFKSGSSVHSKALRMVYLEGLESGGAVSYISPKSLGKAHTRNRARRLLREAFVLSETCVDKNIGIAIIARAPALGMCPVQLSSEIARLVLQIQSKKHHQSHFSSSYQSTGHSYHQSFRHDVSTHPHAQNMPTMQY